VQAPLQEANMIGLSLAALGFVLLVFFRGASVEFAAHAALELILSFNPIAMAVLVILGLYAGRKEWCADAMHERLYWNDVRLGAAADAVGYLLFSIATWMVIDRPWLSPSWKDVVLGVIAAALANIAWKFCCTAASFFGDALKALRKRR